MGEVERLLDTTEKPVSFSEITEILSKLEDEAKDKELFHKISMPFLKGIGFSDTDIVSVLRRENIKKDIYLTKYTIRKAFIDTKALVGKEHDEYHVEVIFKFARGIGFSTLDAIKVFCNDRIA